MTTGTLDSFDARITNNEMYKGKVGVETTKGKHSFGLNYGIGGGNRGRVDQTLQANYRYQFQFTELGGARFALPNSTNNLLARALKPLEWPQPFGRFSYAWVLSHCLYN